MKTIKYTVAIIWAFITVVACNDIVEVDDLRKREDPPSTGAPIVEKVVLATDTLREISGANMEDMVKIQGKNLGNVRKARFNDVEVDPAEIYSTYYTTVIPVPRIKPDQVNDILYIETDNGSLELPFTVSIPPLRIAGLKNEFTQPGDTTIIQGDNFDLYGITVEEADIRMGDLFINMLSASRNELTIQIPSNAQPNSVISILGANMDETAELKYRDPGASKLFNFNDWPGFGAFTHASNYPHMPANFLCDGTLVGQPEPLEPGTKYIRFNDKVNAWGWMVMWAGYIRVPAEVAADLSAYDLRFEINTHAKYPIGTQARLILGDYQWYPAASGLPVNTYGGWQTMRISADETDLLPKDLDPANNIPWKIIFSPEQETEFDLSMCNFRFVRK